MRVLLVLISCVASLLPSFAAAQSDPYVPEALAEWQAWVLEGEASRDCPFVANRALGDALEFVCSWPGELSLVVAADGAAFRQRVNVYADAQWLALPGNTQYWPQQVTVNGRRVAVVERGGVPSLQVDAGQQVIAGRILWAQRPGALPVPPQTGLVSLTLNGERVERPERNAQGVWLGERKVKTQTEDSLKADVYRLVRDDIPTYLVTQLQLEIAGGVREERLGPVLPDGLTPMSVNSPIPARVEPDGTLLVQARPGSWRITVTARADGVLDNLALAAKGAQMPPVEIWSYARNDNLRVSVPGGLAPVDPGQVDVPDEWQQLPAFRITSGQALEISERSRGQTVTDNQLNLTRQLWLDFDGDGFVFNDAIDGEMHSGWRLDMRAPYRLQSAEAGEQLLVTQGADPALTGVEVRQRALDFNASGRLEARGEVPVSGWQARFDAVSMNLYLPVGHRLFMAAGADQAFGSWLQQWRLLDFFVLLITAVASTRLFGKRVGALSLVVLLLTLHENGAPAFLWLNLLAATALARLAPEGRLLQASKLYRGLSVALLILLLIPYAALQLRAAIYPQLEWGGGAYPAAMSPAPMVEEEYADDAGALRSEPRRMQANDMQEIIVTASRVKSTFERYAPDALVAVGPGLPDWGQRGYRLQWNGPVSAEQTLRLVVMPSWAVSLWRVLGVLLMGLYAAFFVLEALKRRLPWTSDGDDGASGASAGAAMLLIASLSIGLAAPTAQAQMPSPELLQELKTRLLAPPDCAPNCAVIAAAAIEVRADTVTMTLSVDALAEVGVPLPGSLNGWQPQSVTVDGQATDAMFSRDNAFWLKLDPGVHEVRLRGELPPADSVEIPFVERPKRVVLSVDDNWLAAGVSDGRLAAGALQLTRQRRAAAEDGARWESNRLPSFVRVERSLAMNLDWRLTTTVRRLAPEQGAINVRVRLLDGERVTSEGISVRDGEAIIALAPNARGVSFTSVLPATTALDLTAADASEMVEVWRFQVGSIWSASFDGVPESPGGGGNDAFRTATFYPRGGETLAMTVTRPAAIGGETLTFDSVTSTTSIGQRTRDTTLSLSYRSTRGAQHVITLPADARVGAVQIDGRESALRPQDGQLAIPVTPGEHNVQIDWQQDHEIGVIERAPVVDLGIAASNIDTVLQVPRNRWVLALGGPALGPAVLYWSELAALILFALILARIPLTPLGRVQWLLLGIGFSTFSWLALLCVVVWLLAIGAKQKVVDRLNPVMYNTLQVVLGGLTVIALAQIVVGLPRGLLGTPDMSIRGNGSYNGRLAWFSDQTDSLLPDSFVFSLPMWCYKALILIWALWLSFALLRWLPWAWQRFSDGGLWQEKPKANA